MYKEKGMYKLEIGTEIRELDSKLYYIGTVEEITPFRMYEVEKDNEISYALLNVYDKEGQEKEGVIREANLNEDEEFDLEDYDYYEDEDEFDFDYEPDFEDFEDEDYEEDYVDYEEDNVEQEDVINTTQTVLYYDRENNNLIAFEYSSYEENESYGYENKEEIVEEVLLRFKDKAVNYLLNKLDYEENTFIIVGAAAGEDNDYTFIHAYKNILQDELPTDIGKYYIFKDRKGLKVEKYTKYQETIGGKTKDISKEIV